MNTTLTRTVLALSSMLVCLGAAQAEGLKYSDLEERLAKVEAQLVGRQGVQLATHCDGCGCCDSCCCSDDCCCGDACCCECGDCCGGCGSCCQCCNTCGCGGGAYAEVQWNFLRAHVLEGAGSTGKLSEEYELSPRFILGMENGCGQGARIRYWHHGHQHNDITQPGGVRFEADVLDLEVTNRFQGCRTDVILAGGVRLANLGIIDNNIITPGGNDDIDLLGLTMAADAESLICCDCSRYFSLVYGARLSILGGDWQGGGNAFVGNPPPRDDNVVVTELYTGIEVGCCYRGSDIFGRLAFEMQNWHSDALAAAANTDSIGFVGPGVHMGVGF